MRTQQRALNRISGWLGRNVTDVYIALVFEGEDPLDYMYGPMTIWRPPGVKKNQIMIEGRRIAPNTKDMKILGYTYIARVETADGDHEVQIGETRFTPTAVPMGEPLRVLPATIHLDTGHAVPAPIFGEEDY